MLQPQITKSYAEHENVLQPQITESNAEHEKVLQPLITESYAENTSICTAATDHQGWASSSSKGTSSKFHVPGWKRNLFQVPACEKELGTNVVPSSFILEISVIITIFGITMKMYT